MAAKKQVLCAALATFAMCSAAQAGVVYNWSQVSGSPTIDSSAGRIEVTDSAWRSGGLATQYTNFLDAAAPFDPVPGSQLLDFYFAVNGIDMQVRPRNPNGIGADGGFRIDLDLAFNDGDPLAGSIDAITLENQIDFGGDPLWTIARFGSDEIIGDDARCFEGPQCFGATGRWSIDETTIPPVDPGLPPVAVAEPPVFLLFSGGLVVIGLAWRKRSRVHLKI